MMTTNEESNDDYILLEDQDEMDLKEDKASEEEEESTMVLVKSAVSLVRLGIYMFVLFVLCTLIGYELNLNSIVLGKQATIEVVEDVALTLPSNSMGPQGLLAQEPPEAVVAARRDAEKESERGLVNEGNQLMTVYHESNSRSLPNMVADNADIAGTVISESTFQGLGQTHPNVFVYFDHHVSAESQQTIATWNKFAQTVQADKMPLKVVRVNCYKSEALCRKLHVRRLPTMRWFVRGGAVTPDYKGGHTVESLLEYSKSTIAMESGKRSIETRDLPSVAHPMSLVYNTFTKAIFGPTTGGAEVLTEGGFLGPEEGRAISEPDKAGNAVFHYLGFDALQSG